MTADLDSLSDLILGVRSLAGASAPTEVFKRLLEAGRSMAPSVAVYLVRQGEIHGWRSSGLDPESAETQKRFRTREGRGWLGRIAASEGDLVERDLADDYPPGRLDAVETVGGALRVDERPIAIVVFERAPGESPWHPDGLELLFAVARLRLELILVRRRSTAAAAGTAREPAAPPRIERAPGDAEPTEVEPWEAETAASASPEYEAARRYARLVATDIRLYNEEAVVLGRRNGDLAQRLREPLGRGEETFMERHGDLGPRGLEILRDAYIQVLAGGDSHLFPTGPDAF